MYYRFATSARNRDSHLPEGFFATAYKCRDALDCGSVIHTWIEEALAWFQEHLDAPEYLPERAIFWFRADSDRCQEAAWSLAHALRENGETVLVLRTRRPGRVVWEDEDQVAAIPFRDRHWRASAY